MHDLGVQPGPAQDFDWYRLGQPAYSSWEVIVELNPHSSPERQGEYPNDESRNDYDAPGLHFRDGALHTCCQRFKNRILVYRRKAA